MRLSRQGLSGTSSLGFIHLCCCLSYLILFVSYLCLSFASFRSSYLSLQHRLYYSWRTVLVFVTLPPLQVHITCEFGDPIEDTVSLLDHFPVLCILQIWSVGLDYATEFVNLGCESACRNESAQL